MTTTHTTQPDTTHQDNPQNVGLTTGLYREGEPIVDTKAPNGDIGARWGKRKFEARPVNPSNRRKPTVSLLGTGQAGATACAPPRGAASHLHYLCRQDPPRRYPVRHTPRRLNHPGQRA